MESRCRRWDDVEEGNVAFEIAGVELHGKWGRVLL